MTGMISTARFNVHAMISGADAEALVATDLAEWLVQRGTPFREAHAIVGKVVRDALANGTPMVDIVRTHESFGADAVSLFDPGVAVARRRTPGGAGPEAAPAQKERLDDAIADAKKRLS
jgi:argininosuccinate lyase